MKLGSLFSGIGGFELGLERAIPGLKTIWQVEQNNFCQKVLRKHWPEAKIHDDVKNITAQNVEPIDILCGGFPCQDISIAGKKRGIHEGKKSSLWWEMLRIIGELEPKIVVLENVPTIISNGGSEVVGSLASIGYDCEWRIISAQQFGAPHLRKRWFCVTYPHRSSPRNRTEIRSELEKTPSFKHEISPWLPPVRPSGNNQERSYWKEISSFSPLCGMDDGIPQGLDQAKLKEKHRKESLKAFGNAIVPQCSEYIGKLIFESGLLDDQ
jgi:DNA (cytosine-5)-methyltransferase 1